MTFHYLTEIFNNLNQYNAVNLGYNLDFFFDLLILKIYSDLIKNSRSLLSIVIILGLLIKNCAYAYFFPYIIALFISIFLLLILVNWLYCYSIKCKYPHIYSVIKYLIISVFLLSLITLFVLIYHIISLWISIVKFSLITKLHAFKGFLEDKLKKNPKDPKKPYITHFFSDLQKKRKLKDLKKKVAKKQSSNYANNVIDRNGRKLKNGIIRDWKGIVEVKQEIFSKGEVIQDINERYEFYKNQKNRFENILLNISQKKENFYPNESASLFREYKNLIDHLLEGLQSMEEEVKKFKE